MLGARGARGFSRERRDRGEIGLNLPTAFVCTDPKEKEFLPLAYVQPMNVLKQGEHTPSSN